jgi:parvulin-like peptidyl-prolyl isomerase
MKLGRTLFILFIMMVLLTQVSTLWAQTRTLYVNVPEENLRNAPNGRKLGSVVEGTDMLFLYEKDNWVKVQLTGWIWKPSLTSLKKSTAEGEFRALHIMVATRAEADAIVKELAAGKEFGEVAKQKSKSPSAAKGGDLGYFNKGDFNSIFENAISALKADEISPVVEAANGFNIFKRIK